MKFTTHSPLQTKEMASVFAKELVKIKGHKSAVVVALLGDLGTGKSTFVRYILKTLGVKQKIASPTFTLMRKYKIPGYSFVAYHLDCYRLKEISEVEHLGLKEILKDPKAIIFIEWPELIAKILPKDKIKISITHGQSENQRTFNIS